MKAAALKLGNVARPARSLLDGHASEPSPIARYRIIVRVGAAYSRAMPRDVVMRSMVILG